MVVAGLILAAVIGVLLGLLGGGGSILAVPVFAYVLDLDPKLAIAASFGVVGIGSLAATLSHWRGGNVDVRSALLFAAGSATVSFAAGAWLSRLLSGSVQMIVFGVVMAVAAIFMFLGRNDPDAPPPEHRRTPRELALFMLMGVAVGVITGIAGVGGGFMIVPALVLLGGVPMRRAVGSSLLVIAINSFAAFVGYLLQPAIRDGLLSTTIGGIGLPLYLGAFAVLAIGGAFGGAVIGSRVPARVLRLGFASFLVVMATYILVRTSV